MNDARLTWEANVHFDGVRTLVGEDYEHCTYPLCVMHHEAVAESQSRLEALEEAVREWLVLDDDTEMMIKQPNEWYDSVNAIAARLRELVEARRATPDQDGSAEGSETAGGSRGGSDDQTAMMGER